MPKIRNRRLSEKVAEEIKAIINKTGLNPGDLLPSEADLARDLEVSRTTVREALRILELGGLIQTRQGKGSTVTLPNTQFLQEALAKLVNDQGSEFEYLMQAREILEPAAARMAAMEATPEQVNCIKERFSRARKKVEEGSYSVEDSIAFHHEIMNAIGNTLLSSLTKMVISLIERSTHLTFNIPSRPRDSLLEHERILKAIINRDPLEAEHAMQGHLMKVKENLRKVLEGDQGIKE